MARACETQKLSARRQFQLGNRAFGVRELAPAFTVSTPTPKPATQRHCRNGKTVPATAGLLSRRVTLRPNERLGGGAAIAKAAASRRTPKRRRDDIFEMCLPNIGKTAIFGGLHILLTRIYARQHYRTHFPARHCSGPGFPFAVVSATLRRMIPADGARAAGPTAAPKFGANGNGRVARSARQTS